MLFVGIVFILMWLFQVVFLEHFYEYIKIRDTEKVANNLIHAYHDGSFRQTALNIGLSNDLCIELMDKNGKELYAQCMYSHNCLLHSTDSDPFFYLVDLQHSKTGTICRSVFNQNMQNNMIVYGKVMQNDNHDVVGYLLLNSPLVPVESTVSILKRQAMSITLILVFLGCVISFCVARHIARPITRITKSAHRLAHGDYQTVFEGGGYAEVDELAQTLTYAEQELSKTDAMQRDLIANVSHDLRTPLTGIIGNSSLYLEQADVMADAEKKELIFSIQSDANWLLNLVENLLTVTRIQGDNLLINTRPEPVEEVVSEALERVKKRFPDVKIHASVPEEMLFIPMDPVLIEQVIINLIENAIVHSETNEPIDFTVSVTENKVSFCIKDYGKGIDPQKLPTLFDGGDVSGMNSYDSRRGMGIGLSICKTIVRAHHGEIYCKNHENGAVFCFVLPKGEIKIES